MTPPDAELRAGSPRRTGLVCLALFFGTLLLFSRAVNHDFLDLDDPDYVTRNAHVQAGLSWSGAGWAFTTGTAGNWHPLTWFSHMLDWQWFGNNPHGHHAINIVWHAGNAVLAFLALRRLTGAFWTSAASAALFAWHPLRVESVAWVAERKDVLSTFFALLALLSYARYARGREKFPAQRMAVGLNVDYALTLVCFALGLMCKPMLVTLPLVLLMLDFWPLNRFRPDRHGATLPKLVLEKLPFLLLSLASCVVTSFAQTKSGAFSESLSFANRLADALVALAGYLGKFFWPVNLAIGYPRPVHQSIGVVAGAGLLLAGITGLAWLQRRQRPWLIVGWLWFLGMLVPVIGLVPVGRQLMADRYTCLPVLGLQLALLWTLREALVFRGTNQLAAASAVAVLAISAARTWDQLAVWQNSRTLYEHALALDPDNYLAHTYLGSTLLNENEPDAARSHFQKAVELRPDYRLARLRFALALERLDRANDALAVYQDWLKVRPDDAEVQYDAGVLLFNRDQPAEALVHFQAAAEIRTNDAAAYFGLGLAQEQLERTQAAIGSLERAQQLDPQIPGAAEALIRLRDKATVSEFSRKP